MSNTAWVLTDVAQLLYMGGMNIALQPSSFYNYGWNMAFWSSFTLQGVPTILYLLYTLQIGSDF